MNNIGSVFYSKGDEPGTLNAKWCHSTKGIGTGFATGGPNEGYVGLYKITYFDNEGNLISERGLEIKKNGECYDVSWINNGIVTSKGIGIEVESGLVVGWFSIDVGKK